MPRANKLEGYRLFYERLPASKPEDAVVKKPARYTKRVRLAKSLLENTIATQ